MQILRNVFPGTDQLYIYILAVQAKSFYISAQIPAVSGIESYKPGVSRACRVLKIGMQRGNHRVVLQFSENAQGFQFGFQLLHISSEWLPKLLPKQGPHTV